MPSAACPLTRALPSAVLALLLGGCLTVELPKAHFHAGPQGKALAWKQVVEEALARHPDLEAARQGVLSSARSRDIALGGYLPEIAGEMNRSRTRSVSGPAADELALELTAEQALFTGFDTTGKYLQSRRDFEAAQWDYQDISARVRYRLRSQFIELLRIKKFLDVVQRIEVRRNRNAEMIELRYEAGREHQGSALRAKAIAGLAAFEVHQTQRRGESQSVRFEREMGGDFVLPVDIAGDLEEMVPSLPAQKPDFAALAEEVPQVKRALKQAEALKAAVISAQSAVWPKVDGTAAAGYAGDRASHLEEESFLGLRVSLPFFSGGKNIAAIRKARADYARAREIARSTRDEVIALLAEAWAQYADAVEAVSVRKRFAAAARKRSEIVRAEYEAGLVNFQDFDITEQDIADSEKNYVESLANVLIQQANWALVRGATLEDALHDA